MIDNKPPCFECPERHDRCHGTCEKYKAWSEQRATERELIRLTRYAQQELCKQYRGASKARRIGIKRGEKI